MWRGHAEQSVHRLSRMQKLWNGLKQGSGLGRWGLSSGLNPLCFCRGQHANWQATSWHWLQDLLRLHDAAYCVWGLPLQCSSLPLFPAAQLPAPGCRRTEDLRSPVELGLFSWPERPEALWWKDLAYNHMQVKRTRAFMVFQACWGKVPVFSLELPVWGGCHIITGVGGRHTYRH